MAGHTKQAFTQRWVENILTGMESHVEKKALLALMESCGRACANASAVKSVQGCQGNYNSLQAVLRRWLGKENVWRDEEGVHLIYSRCFCRLPAEIPSHLAATYCRCSCGWVKEIFAAALDRQVEVSLQSSIKQGADVCRFLVSIRD